MILEVAFEREEIQFFISCQNDGCEVLQLYYLVSKQPPTVLYEIINLLQKVQKLKIKTKMLS